MGKTLSLSTYSGSLWKHPHAHGEDNRPPHNPPLSGETPPRTWGRLAFLSALSISDGNTPTHMGKTLSNRINVDHGWKHPHAHGEDRVKLGVKNRYTGNTPTHMGKTSLTLTSISCGWKHPHAHGETPVVDTISPALKKHPHAHGEDLRSATSR